MQASVLKDGSQTATGPADKMAPLGNNLPELFFRDNNNIDSVERYNVVYRRPDNNVGQAH